ncbi:self-incompatibility protein S1-like [Elaeis guineensis]
MLPIYMIDRQRQHHQQEQSMASWRYVVAVVAMLVVLAPCDEAVKVHVSILNRLGKGRSIDIHCQSKDNDLGLHTIPDGGEYGWDFSVNAFGSTLFYCDLAWEAVPEFHFDAYAYWRDQNRCSSQCSWLLAQEGVYGLNEGTGLWEFMYAWGS